MFSNSILRAKCVLSCIKYITTAADFSTPENKSKVIELTINGNYLGSAISNQGFEKLTGADADKKRIIGKIFFTL
jgi:hypothetical protein